MSAISCALRESRGSIQPHDAVPLHSAMNVHQHRRAVEMSLFSNLNTLPVPHQPFQPLLKRMQILRYYVAVLVSCYSHI